MNDNASILPPRRFDAEFSPQLADLRLLAIGTSTERCSVAVWTRQAGHGLGLVIDSPAGAGQSGQVLSWVRELLSMAQLGLTDVDAIAFDAGPGAFTGLRIGCGVAQGLGFTVGRPLLPVTSLAAIAMASAPRADSDRLIAVDARMQEVYWSIMPAGADPSHDPCAIRVSAAPDVAQVFESRRLASVAQGRPGPLLLGNGFERYAPLSDWAADRGLPVDASAWPDASRLARVAEGLWRHGVRVDPADAAPVYVRDKVALDATEQARLRDINRLQAAGKTAPGQGRK